jgi:hypothetical protein
MRACWLAAALLAACGGSSAGTDRTPIRSDRALSCDALLADLEQLDVPASSEATLERWMHAADNSISTCEDALLGEARTPGEQVIARHMVRQISIQARYLEAELAIRFDDGAHLCAIIAEAFEALIADLAEIEEALALPDLPDADRRLLTQLRDLDLEATDVLVASAGDRCR